MYRSRSLLFQSRWPHCSPPAQLDKTSGCLELSGCGFELKLPQVPVWVFFFFKWRNMQTQAEKKVILFELFSISDDRSSLLEVHRFLPPDSDTWLRSTNQNLLRPWSRFHLLSHHRYEVETAPFLFRHMQSENNDNKFNISIPQIYYSHLLEYAWLTLLLQQTKISILILVDPETND